MLPIPGNIEMKIVKSGSMEPAIPTGSIVVVKPETIYREGDVITFGKDTKTDIPTTHRIVALNNDGTYTVKGDANEEEDENHVSRGTVIGKVIFHLPYAGYVLDFARQPIGFMLLIAVPAGLVIMEEVLTIFKETRRWMKKRDDDEEPSSGGHSESLGAHLKKVYVRRRAMDEIFIPCIVQPWAGRPSRFARFFHSDAYGTSTVLTVGLIFTATLFSGASGGTVSYFQDIEKSMGNIFGAGQRWADEAEAELLAQQEKLLSFSALSLSEDAPPEIPCPEQAGEGDECLPAEGPPVEPPVEPEGAVLGTESAPEPEETTPPVEETTAPSEEPENTPEDPVADPDVSQTAPIETLPPAEPPADDPPQPAVPSETTESPPAEPPLNP